MIPDSAYCMFPCVERIPSVDMFTLCEKQKSVLASAEVQVWVKIKNLTQIIQLQLTLSSAG